MFELTGGLTYIVPIMIAVMISKWVGDAIVSDGMYPLTTYIYKASFKLSLYCILSVAIISRSLSSKTTTETCHKVWIPLTFDPSYDGHIRLYGYPFLDSKREFTHNTLACDVMRPRKNDPPLTIIDLSQVTIGVLQDLVSDTDYFGFPCVLDSTSQLLAGFLTRKDITHVLGNGWGSSYFIEKCLLLCELFCLCCLTKVIVGN